MKIQNRITQTRICPVCKKAFVIEGKYNKLLMFQISKSPSYYPICSSDCYLAEKKQRGIY